MPGRSGQGSSPVRRNETKSHAEERALGDVLLHFRLGHESLDVTRAYLKGKDAFGACMACLELEAAKARLLRANASVQSGCGNRGLQTLLTNEDVAGQSSHPRSDV